MTIPKMWQKLWWKKDLRRTSSSILALPLGVFFLEASLGWTHCLLTGGGTITCSGLRKRAGNQLESERTFIPKTRASNSELDLIRGVAERGKGHDGSVGHDVGSPVMKKSRQAQKQGPYSDAPTQKVRNTFATDVALPGGGQDSAQDTKELEGKKGSDQVTFLSEPTDSPHDSLTGPTDSPQGQKGFGHNVKDSPSFFKGSIATADAARAIREQKAVKSDDAAVPEHLWKDHLFAKAGWEKKWSGNRGEFEKACILLKSRMLLWWRRMVTRSLNNWLKPPIPSPTGRFSRFKSDSYNEEWFDIRLDERGSVVLQEMEPN